MNDDEYMEVTPESIRLRKQILLDKNLRAKAAKKKKSSEVGVGQKSVISKKFDFVVSPPKVE